VALAILAAGVSAATVHMPHAPGVAVLVLMALLLSLTEFMQVRQYHYRGHGVSLNLIEAVLAPVVYACDGFDAMLVAAAGLAAAELFRRTGSIKTVFNTAQWVLAAAVGSLVLHSFDLSNAGTAVLATASAVIAMSLVNQVTVGLVMYFAVSAAHERQSRSQMLSGVANRLAAGGAALITGVTLVAAYRWHPALLLVGAAFVLGLDAAGRAHANVRADSQRLEGLQQATHALATSLDLETAVPVFLRETLAGFEARSAQLFLFDDGDLQAWSWSGESGSLATPTDGDLELAAYLSEQSTRPRHIAVEHGEPEIVAMLESLGHRRCLAAPLVSGERRLGILLLFDRLGVEGFEKGELTIAAALARELVGFFERVELLATVEAERRKLTQILESTSDGILTIDSDGVVTSWNAGLAAITGYSAAEMVGTRHFGLLRARDAGGRDIMIERWCEMFETAAGLPPELQIVSAGSDSVWLSCSYSRIAASESQGDTLVIVARNITQARELERLKDDFVAVVSHELRTPLVPIKGWAQTLINRGDRLNDDQRRTAVQSILSQAQKLESLVLNILEASRIESGRGDGDGVADVAAVTMRIVEDTLAARPDRVVRVRPPAVPCEVRGSAVWVERAVSNLVANALKYSPDDEPVDVAVFTEGTDVLVSVTDRGPGIAADAHERIFERFERLEESRTQTGTGLGLYITRRLARAMGGDVTVSSVPGAGSTFVLRIPAAPVVWLPDQRSTESAAPPLTSLSAVEATTDTETQTDSGEGTVVRIR
jgi:PAS domain S-box-containing protein